MSDLAALLDGVTALLGRRDLTQVEFENWKAGSANGGPNGDGNFPMTDSTGFVRLVPSPAKIAKMTTFRAATLAAAAAQDLSGFDLIRTDAFATAGDGGGAAYARVGGKPNSGAANLTYFSDAQGAWFELQPPAASAVDVRVAGIMPSGNQTTRLQALCSWAENKGVAEVFAPFDLTVNNSTDLFGRVIVGNDTRLSGYTRNGKAYRNIRLNNVNQSDLATHPTPLADRTPKLLWRESENLYFVAVQKEDASKGYNLISFRNNSTTANESIASNSTNMTRWRVIGVDDAVFVGMVKSAYESASPAANWQQTQASGGNQFANLIPKNTNARPMKYWRANQNGDTITFKATARKGRVNVAFLCGTGTDANVGVSIDGAAPVSVSTQATTSNTIRTFWFATSKGDGESVAITLTKNGQNGVSFFPIGVNFCELRDWDETAADHYFYYRDNYDPATNPTGRVSYLTQASSNDFVLRDFGSATYGVHYHGGETDIVSKWYLENAEVAALTADQKFVVGRNLELRGSCKVDWTSLPGGLSKITCEEFYRFGAGGYSNYNLAYGLLDVEEIYTAMFGAAESFTEIIEPVRTDTTAAPNLARVPAGRCNRVTMRNPSTRQKITLEFSVFANEENHYGGPHWRKVLGSYLKFYYGPVLEGRRQYSSISSVTNVRFEAA